jgi:ankyrin repeat protein
MDVDRSPKVRWPEGRVIQNAQNPADLPATVTANFATCELPGDFEFYDAERQGDLSSSHVTFDISSNILHSELPVQVGHQGQAELPGDSSLYGAELQGPAVDKRTSNTRTSPRSVNLKCTGCQVQILDSLPRVRCLDCVDHVSCANCHLAGRSFGRHLGAHRHQVLASAAHDALVASSSGNAAVELQTSATVSARHPGLELRAPATPSGHEMELEFEIIESLRTKAIAKFEAGDYNPAEGLGRSAIKLLEATAQGAQFDGRNELLELLAISCWKQGKWNEAESILLELINAGDVGYDRDLRLIHTLAEVYMAEGDLNKAADYCFRTAKGRRSAFGKGHVLFLDSVALLVEIYEAKGDEFEAQGYEGTYLIVPISEARVPSEKPDNNTSWHMRIILHSCSLLRLASEKRRVARWEERNAIQWLEENNFASVFNKGSGSEIDEVIAAKALHKAGEQGHMLAMRLLLKRGANVNARIPCENTTSTALESAVEHGQEVAVNFLLDNGAEIDQKAGSGRTALHCAAQYGREAIVQFMLKEGAFAGARDNRGLTPFNYAAIDAHEAVMNLLLDNGAEIEEAGEDGITALHSVAMKGKWSAVENLLRRGANVHAKDTGGRTSFDKGGRTALHNVASSEHHAIAILLIENGADVNAKDNNGSTALHLARSENMVQALLDKGADIYIRASLQRTALHFPVDPGAIDLLLAKGLLVDSKDELGGTPLDAAVRYLLVTMAWKLMEKGANVNATDNFGRTPLYIAVERVPLTDTGRREEMVKLLLAYGADPLKTVAHLGSPLSLANFLEDDEIVALLTMMSSEIISVYFPQGISLSVNSVSETPPLYEQVPTARPPALNFVPQVRRTPQ